MKQLKFAARCFATVLLATTLLPSCSSDPNPLGYLNVTGDKSDNGKSYIQLDLNAALTRATDDRNATDDEVAISKVDIYLFNSNNVLEDILYDVPVNDNSKVTVQITSGKKTIYAITANKILTPKSESTISEFENEIFNSELSNLKTDNGFVMVGKSEAKDVVDTKSPINLPETNKFSISLTRLVSKVQLKSGTLTFKGFDDIHVSDMSFKAFQINKEMRLVSNGYDLQTSFTDEDNDGTYDTYSNETDDYIAVSSGFSPNNCQYVTENIVAKPLSGNTTFIGVRIQMTPRILHYIKDEMLGTVLTNTSVYDEPIPQNGNFYVLAVNDADNNIIDFIVDNSNRIMCFKNEESASFYKNEASSLPKGYDINILEYKDGYVYYRINIAEGSGDSKKYKVVRNKFYKIELTGVSNFGVPSESYLRPTKADSKLDSSNLAAWSDAVFNVVTWTDDSQSVDL